MAAVPVGIVCVSLEAVGKKAHPKRDQPNAPQAGVCKGGMREDAFTSDYEAIKMDG
jgi:hypothetical protein